MSNILARLGYCSTTQVVRLCHLAAVINEEELGRGLPCTHQYLIIQSYLHPKDGDTIEFWKERVRMPLFPGP